MLVQIDVKYNGALVCTSLLKRQYTDKKSMYLEFSGMKLSQGNCTYKGSAFPGLDKQDFQHKIVNIFLPIIFSI